MKYVINQTLKIIIVLFISTTIHSTTNAQEVDKGIFKKVLKMANRPLKDIYDDPAIVSKIKEIKSSMIVPATSIMHSSYHNDVDLSQVSFDVEVKYIKVINPEIGEIASFTETLKCVLSKYRSLKWNRLSFYQNDCLDCGDVTLVEHKRAVNRRYIQK